MNREVKGLISAWLPQMQEPILEIGSKIVNEGFLTNKEEFFIGRAYIGVDLEAGSGVDIIADATKGIPAPDGIFSTILCFDTLEHVDKPWKMMEEVNRVSAKDALIVMSAAFQYGLHSCPSDYWRFSTEGLRVLLEGWDVVEAGYITHGRIYDFLKRFGIEPNSGHFAKESYIIGRKR